MLLLSTLNLFRLICCNDNNSDVNIIAFVQGNSPDNEQLVVDLHYARLMQISYLRMKVSDFWSVKFASV